MCPAQIIKGALIDSKLFAKQLSLKNVLFFCFHFPTTPQQILDVPFCAERPCIKLVWRKVMVTCLNVRGGKVLWVYAINHSSQRTALKDNVSTILLYVCEEKVFHFNAYSMFQHLIMHYHIHPISTFNLPKTYRHFATQHYQIIEHSIEPWCSDYAVNLFSFEMCI